MITAIRPAASVPRFMPSVCCNGLMQFNTYTVAGAQVAVWLVNQPAPVVPELASVLAGYDVHEPADAAALRPWARRLRAVFEADEPEQRAGLADALLTAADCRPRLVSHGPGL